MLLKKLCDKAMLQKFLHLRFSPNYQPCLSLFTVLKLAARVDLYYVVVHIVGIFRRGAWIKFND